MAGSEALPVAGSGREESGGLSAEAHRAIHEQAHGSLVLLIALYESASGKSQGQATLLDLFVQIPLWWPVPSSEGVQSAWRVWDQTLACYIQAEWPAHRLMSAEAGILSGTTLAEFVAWNGAMGRAALAVGEETSRGSE